MKPIKIGIAQINPIVGNFVYNRNKIIHMIDLAEKRGLDWVVFSELSLSGYPVWDLATKKNFVDRGLESLDRIVASTRRKHITAVVGFIDRGPANGRKSHNALAVISGGRVLHKQYKTLLPTYDVFLEEMFFQPASEQKIFSYRGIPVGTSICEDIWDEHYSVKPASALARKGAKLILNISASPYHARAGALRDELIRKKARETGSYFVYVNQVGGQDDLIFDGRSLVASPDGSLIFRGEAFKEDLYEVTIDPKLKKIRGAVKTISFPEDRPGGGDPAEIYEALKLGVRDYVHKNNFSRVVLGLSGGIDSALTACIAADAIGPHNVIGVAMPGEYSSAGSLSDAREIAKRLRLDFRIRPIAPRYREFLRESRKSKSREGRKARSGGVTLAMQNLQSRMRGMELMYLSNDENVLLVSTGNKSELATGYCTLYGDMSGGLCVLGDVYKTDVYRLADFRNRISPVIPRAIIEKAPSAELKPNQKDQDSLPPYDLLDEILYLYIEKDKSRDEIVLHFKKRRVSAGLIQDVINRVDFNEYKRRQAPPILRVSEKAWFGRRMPITNHFRG